MSDIHQEWHELRKKNRDFICHLDGEMAKLKRDKKMQDLADAGAFAIRFMSPPPFNCCQDDRDILKAINREQANRIEHLKDEIIAYKQQQDVDLAVKKDLDEKLDKATADYRALWVERDNLMDTISRMEKTIRDFEERNSNLRERLANTNESLKRNIQEVSKLQSTVNYLEGLKQYQAKEILRLKNMVDTANGSCSTYAQQGMQSKIAKQSNEIKRLTEENKQLHKALDIAAKDADANFERGKIKGMSEIWKELVDCYYGRPTDENNKIFGYYTVGDILMNLSPTWFINRAEEYHKQEEKKEQQDKIIQIGDEVQCFDLFCPDDDPHSDIGIVVIVDSERHSFVVIGPNFEGCFDTTDIQFGTVKKTGRHFNSIPLDYLA